MKSNELEGQERKHGHVEDVKMLKQKIETLHTEIKALKKENSEIKVQVEMLTGDYDSLDFDNKDLGSKFRESRMEKMELEQSCAKFLAAEKKLKLQIASLEMENKRQARQYSESLNIIDEIAFEVENLQKEELDMQAQIFQEDLEAVTELKVEQEQRAIQAEDALRKMTLSNAEATERLQEDFKRISAEMSLKNEENEKLAQKAVAEVNDLHQKNEDLEGLLQKATEELQIIKEKNERTIREHSEQNESISGGKSYQKTTSESETLESQLDSVRKEAENFKHENVSMKSQIKQKKTKEDNLLLQVKKLRITNNEAKSHLLLELEQEKEGLKIEMLKLQGNLRKKEKELEKAELQISVNSPAKEQNLKCSTTEVRKYQETIPLRISGHSNVGCDVSSLVGEVASLKERNKSMEEELKEMQNRYSEKSLRFAEVEGKRQQLVMALRKKN